ncbi:hypothetical protein DL96DRAFT_1557274 [Flagelloscypha sp. PMI_526]|nr:hypothetical protein DL96DRAFT_1557274 [Flagelloscypha sp. PMI_526]
MATASTNMNLAFGQFSDFPAELQGNIWRYAAWAATKPEQARLLLISKDAMYWAQDVLYHSIHAENVLLKNIATILQNEMPSAALFRKKTQSSSHVVETLRSIATLPRLKEVRLPPHYFYLTPVSQLESTLTLSSITHLIVPTDITTEVPDMCLWTSFPKLTHLVVLITAVPEDDNFEILCTRSPENLLVLDRTPPHLPQFTPSKRFSRTPIIIRASHHRDWVFRKLWDVTSEFWEAVDYRVQEAIARKEDGYFIELKEW